MQILTVKEAREYTKIGFNTLYELFRTGEIEAVRVRGKWLTWAESCDKYILKLSADQKAAGSRT